MASHGVLPISPLGLASASLLLLAAGCISIIMRLRIEGKLALAALRMAVQLLLVGYVLEWVFAVRNPFIVLTVAAFMVFMASRAAVERAARRYARMEFGSLLSLLCSASLTLVAVNALVLRVQPIWSAHYTIPLLGMILGNSLTGVSLCLDVLLEALADKATQIETELAMGATRWESVADIVTLALRRSVLPMLNTMSVAGIVSLPGMMTGQILGGGSPIDAVKYQIVIMLAITVATLLASALIARWTVHALFDDRHRLRYERIVRREKK